MRRELSCSEVANTLGISLSYVTHLTKIGKLPAPRYEGQRPWYDAEAIERFASTWTRRRSRRGERQDKPHPKRGPIAAQAFPLIAAGVDWRGLVVQLQIDPTLARELVTEYETTPEVERAERLRERREKEERVLQRERDRRRRTEDLKAHQLKLVREAKHVTIALPAGSAPENVK